MFPLPIFSAKLGRCSLRNNRVQNRASLAVANRKVRKLCLSLSRAGEHEQLWRLIWMRDAGGGELEPACRCAALTALGRADLRMTSFYGAEEGKCGVRCVSSDWLARRFSVRHLPACLHEREPDDKRAQPTTVLRSINRFDVRFGVKRTCSVRENWAMQQPSLL